MIVDVLGYYRARLIALGRREWRDSTIDACPQNELPRAFHLTPGATTGVSNNQAHQEMEVATSVRVPFMPQRKSTTLTDDAFAFADTVIADILNPRNRLTQTGLKNVYFKTMELEPTADTNDNGVTIRLDFTALVIISTR